MDEISREFLIVIGLAIVFFLVIRIFWLWYWGIYKRENQLSELIINTEQTQYLLKNILQENEKIYKKLPIQKIINNEISNSNLVIEYYIETNEIKKLEILLRLKNRGLNNEIIEKYYTELRKDIKKVQDKEIINQYLITDKKLYAAEMNYRNISSEDVKIIKKENKKDIEKVRNEIIKCKNVGELKDIIINVLEVKSNKSEVFKKIESAYELQRIYGPVSENQYVEKIIKIVSDVNNNKNI